MKKAMFGFSIREDDPVNRVSTPTKLSTYVAYGVIPVFSDCLEGFADVAGKNEYCVMLDTKKPSADRVFDILSKNFEPQKIYESFCADFGKYYSRETHIQNIEDFLGKII